MEHTSARGWARRKRGRGTGGRGGIQRDRPSATAIKPLSPSTTHFPTSPIPSVPAPRLSPVTAHHSSPFPFLSPSGPVGGSSHGTRPFPFGEGTSSATPRGPSPHKHRIRLEPEGSGAQIGYNPSKPGSKALSTVIRLKLDQPYINWQHVPEQVRELWWREWKKLVTWELQHEALMKKAFNAMAARHLQDTYGKARRKGKKPVWMSEHVWQCLCEHWRTEGFIKKSEQSKKNRASETGGSLHTEGYISPGTHAACMAIELGRPPTHLEIFMRTHQCRSDGSWIEGRARKEAFQEELTNQSQSHAGPNDMPSPGSQQSETEVWSRVVGGRNKKGRLYGASYHGGFMARGSVAEWPSSDPSASTPHVDGDMQDFCHVMAQRIDKFEHTQQLMLDTQRSMLEMLHQLVA